MVVGFREKVKREKASDCRKTRVRLHKRSAKTVPLLKGGERICRAHLRRRFFFVSKGKIKSPVLDGEGGAPLGVPN